jgi:hypothetical protein
MVGAGLSGGELIELTLILRENSGAISSCNSSYVVPVRDAQRSNAASRCGET